MKRNLKILSLASVVFGVAVLGWSAIYEQPFGEKNSSVRSLSVGSIPEMDELEFTKDWVLRADLNSAQKSILKKEWEKNFEDVRTFLTAERVKQMSRWSRDAMRNYRYVTIPKPENCGWKTLCHDSAAKCFLMQTTFETLPSDPGMRRELCAWVLFDTSTETISWTLLTIRSELVQEKKKRFLWW